MTSFCQCSTQILLMAFIVQLNSACVVMNLIVDERILTMQLYNVMAILDIYL